MTTQEHCFELNKDQFDELICGNGTQFRDGKSLYCVSVSRSFSPSLNEPRYTAVIVECSKGQSIILNPTAEPVKLHLLNLLQTQQTSGNTVALDAYHTELATAS